MKINWNRLARRACALVLLFVSLTWTMACAQEEQGTVNINPFPPPPTSPVQTTERYGTTPPTVLNEATQGSANLSAVNPDKYRIEPGDLLSVEMWTPLHLVAQGVVAPDGTLDIQPVGNIPVQGVALRKLSSYLQTALQQYYKKVAVTANLVRERTVRVQILGEVRSPGEYELSGVTGALEAIQAAGGLTGKASVRTILLEESGRKAVQLDYFKWRVFGDDSQDPYLTPNAVIYVPVVRNEVTLEGEVKHPGVYEMLSGENYADLIKMAGGFTPQAMQNQATLSRIEPGGKLTKIPVSETVALTNGDSIHVPSLILFQSKIRVIGELVGAETFPESTSSVTGAHSVERSGWYYLKKNETVKDVVIDMGGFTPAADPAHAWVERPEPNGKKKIIKLDLHHILMARSSSQNIVLKDGDTLFVPPSPNSIYVVGEVKASGVFPYTPGSGIQDYVALAGGPTPQGKINHIKLVRFQAGNAQPQVYDVNLEGYLTGHQENLPLLKPGDVIYVPRSVFARAQDVLGFLGNLFLIRYLVP